jgi:hypothetical protein
MSDPFCYMNPVSGERALLLTEEEQLLGSAMLSVETQEQGADDFYVYSREHFAEWLRIVRHRLDSSQPNKGDNGETKKNP